MIAIPATVFAAGLAMLLIAVATGDDYVLSRNLLELWIPFAVAIALLLAAPAIGRLGTAVAVVLSASASRSPSGSRRRRRRSGRTTTNWPPSWDRPRPAG